MSRPFARSSALSVDRAFVVHFAGQALGRRRFSGRVEHLSSGRSARFSSLKGLLAFFATAPDVAGPEGGRGVAGRGPPAGAGRASLTPGSRQMPPAGPAGETT